MNSRAYSADLTNAEWVTIGLQFPVSPYGRDKLHTSRKTINIIYYQARSGCAWRLLPHDLPPWEAVYPRIRQWVGEIPARPNRRQPGGLPWARRGQTNSWPEALCAVGRAGPAAGLARVSGGCARPVRNEAGAADAGPPGAHGAQGLGRRQLRRPAGKRVCGSGAARGENRFPPVGCHGIRAPKTATGSGTNIRMVGEMPASSGPGF